MPSSGYPIENLSEKAAAPEDERELFLLFEKNAKRAMEYGLFSEWLSCFVGAWNTTKDPWEAAWAGITEWDL